MKFSNRYMKIAGWLALAMTAVGLAGCGPNYRTPMDTLNPRSDLAKWIYALFLQVTIWDLIVLVIVTVAMFLAIFWFSSRPGDSDDYPTDPGLQPRGDLRLELAWTLGPALILLFIAVPTVHTIVRSQPAAWSKNTFTVKVRAHQWWWEFDYPDSGIKTANELHLPADRQIHLELISEDVIHSFRVPALVGTRDVVPGQVNEITFTSRSPGEYYGQCAEFCGESHANMRFRVFVQSDADFAKWEKHEELPPHKPKLAAAVAGEKIFKNAPCAICHTIKGISGFSKQYKYGFRGPDLTHFGSRTTFAGSIFTNTPQNVALWIADPDKVKPGAHMPTLGMRGAQLHDLVAYLESLK